MYQIIISSKGFINESDPYVLLFEGDKIKVDLKENVQTSFIAEFQAVRTRVPGHEAAYLLQLRNFELLRKKVKFPTRIEIFWRFAKERLFKFRGTNQKNLFLYLKEIEFRYNKKEIFPALLENLRFSVSGK
ncbi:MAG: hypothetical protein KKA84_16165 [Bacteroidetes bacterium]|nr:hypothetical protein [Bacteroidota bacterium]